MSHGANGSSRGTLGRRPLTHFTPARTSGAIETGRLLPGRDARAATPVRGAPTMAFGTALLVAGLLPFGAASRIAGAAALGAAVPVWAGAVLSAGAVALGLTSLARGRRGLSRRRRARRLREGHPGEPWLWEHPWNAFASFDESGAELRLPCFPCRTGTTLELKLARTPAIAVAGPLRATLRCIQERREPRGAGPGRGRATVYALHEATARGEPTAEGEAIVFRFDVPARAPGTALARRPPRYWELEVESETPGVDWRTAFLLPLYAVSGA